MKKGLKVLLVIIIIMLFGYILYLGFSLKNVTDSVSNIKDESNQRIFENYAKVIEYQYVMSYMKETNISVLEQGYSGESIVCEDSSISADGKLTLIKCKIGDDDSLYSYENNQTKRVK